MSRPGSGDFPVGQFDAQKRLPPGRGTPSFASSYRFLRVYSELVEDGDKPWFTRDAANVFEIDELDMR